MTNETELIEIYRKLNRENKFSVMVYARLKIVRQIASEVKPYVRERRQSERRRIRYVHWVGMGV